MTKNGDNTLYEFLTKYLKIARALHNSGRTRSTTFYKFIRKCSRDFLLKKF